MDDLGMMALKDRSCDAVDRIPTSAYPLLSTTVEQTIAAGATLFTPEFEAERDTLLTDLCIIVVGVTDGVALAAHFDLEYCNTVYAEHDDVIQWRCCCDRKPVFLVGVKENKKLKFAITLAAVAPAGGARVEVSLSGFQGNGCCP